MHTLYNKVHVAVGEEWAREGSVCLCGRKDSVNEWTSSEMIFTAKEREKEEGLDRIS